jgi:hypothetical protein
MVKAGFRPASGGVGSRGLRVQAAPRIRFDFPIGQVFNHALLVCEFLGGVGVGVRPIRLLKPDFSRGIRHISGHLSRSSRSIPGSCSSDFTGSVQERPSRRGRDSDPVDGLGLPRRVSRGADRSRAALVRGCSGSVVTLHHLRSSRFSASTRTPRDECSRARSARFLARDLPDRSGLRIQLPLRDRLSSSRALSGVRFRRRATCDWCTHLIGTLHLRQRVCLTTSGCVVVFLCFG